MFLFIAKSFAQRFQTVKNIKRRQIDFEFLSNERAGSLIWKTNFKSLLQLTQCKSYNEPMKKKWNLNFWRFLDNKNCQIWRIPKGKN